MSDEQADRFGPGLALALISAFSFSLAGPLASGLIAAGWTALALVLARMVIGTGVMVGPALASLKGRWGLLRDNRPLLIKYGVFGVALPNISYFNAVQYLQVAQALLFQYLAPVVLVMLLWVRFGQRPGVRTLLGSAVAIFGLMLVLQVFAGGISLDWRGLAWAMAALVGNSSYFLFASDDSSTLPPAALALGGVLVGLAVMVPVGLVGLLPFAVASTDVLFAGIEMSFLLPLLGLGIFCSGISYLSGISAARILGTRLSSFVGLSEVLLAAAISAVLLGQLLTPGQIVGAGLVLVGVVLVKLGESRIGVPKLATRR